MNEEGFVKQKKHQKTTQEPVPEPQKPTNTEEVVNDYIKRNPDTVSNDLRNERAMKAQRKHMNARSSLNGAFYFVYFYSIINVIKNDV